MTTLLYKFGEIIEAAFRLRLADNQEQDLVWPHTKGG